MSILDFTGRVAYIAGGCGTVGKGAVKSFLAHGASVVISSRSGERLVELRQEIKPEHRDRLFTMRADTTTEEGVSKMMTEIQSKHPVVHHVVSSLGAWWEKGTLTRQSYKEFMQQVENLAGSHFLIAKAFLPLLDEVEVPSKTGSTYTFITGLAGENCLLPEASLVTVGAACLLGVSLAARAEFHRKTVAVSELRIGARVQDTEDAKLRETRTSSHEVGHDKIGDLIVSIAAARCRELQRADNRFVCDSGGRETERTAAFSNKSGPILTKSVVSS